MISSTRAANAAARVSRENLRSSRNEERARAKGSFSSMMQETSAGVSREADAVKQDTVEVHGKGHAGGEFRLDVDSLVQENNQRMQDFTAKLMSMVSKKGETANAKIFGLNLNVTQKDIEEAKASIEEGGQWSVGVVSDRIMNMAYALSGGDESKLSTLKNAVLEGFRQAGFDPDNRSSMPSITGETYDEILSRFDDWEKNGMKPYGMDRENGSAASGGINGTISYTINASVSISGTLFSAKA
ncbi:MAG: hypothetical protein ACI4VM_01015 [Anaerovoracaceae bacterium]